MIAPVSSVCIFWKSRSAPERALWLEDGNDRAPPAWPNSERGPGAGKTCEYTSALSLQIGCAVPSIPNIMEWPSVRWQSSSINCSVIIILFSGDEAERPALLC